ncbi:MAG TPA: methyl-accepting chemotaxis protein [bacterium]|nr:methyl-accepting chemotaxis protein [bacterium]HPN44373.1 methyl-accepting chemotaxis protein [bacterium]
MLRKLLSFARNEKNLAAIYGLVILAVCLALTGIVLVFSSPSATDVVDGSSRLLPGLLLVSGFFVMTCLLIFFALLGKGYQEELRNRIIRFDSATVSHDSQEFTTAMAELAQGNLSVHLDIKSTPLPRSQYEELNPAIDALNIIINSLHNAADEFNKLTDIHCLRLCYVGADSFLEGRKAGEVLDGLLGGKGKILVTTGSFTSSGLELRRKGFMSYLAEKHSSMQIVDVLENHEDTGLAYTLISEGIKKHPDLVGIYVTEGATPGGVAQAVSDAGKAGMIKIVGHDLTNDTMVNIKKGVISGTLGQDPYAQGYDPVIHLYNTIVDNWHPVSPRLLTRMDVVNKENYEQFWREGVGMIQSRESLEHLAKPVQKTPDRQIKIAVLGREDSAFWAPVKKGVLDAASVLRNKNVIVDWIVPEGTRTKKDFSAAVYGPAVEEVISKRYNGLALVSVDRNLVPYINRAVQNGIPVITANSEPTSLRSLVKTIYDQSNNLLQSSKSLSSSAEEVNVATKEISSSMFEMAQDTMQQNDQVNLTRNTLISLLQNIDTVTEKARDSADAVEDTTRAIHSGSQILENTLSSIDVIRSSFGETWRIVEELEKHSSKINGILKMINDIAFQVNLLSLNASIEAARAGEYGKGFMVVANEIRNLANNTANATKDVEKVVQTILSEINKVNKLMDDDLQKFDNISGLTDEVKKTFEKIKQSVLQDQDRIHDITVASADMQNLSNQVGNAMEQVADISQRNAAGVEEVSASTQTMSAQLEHVTLLSNMFLNMAKGEKELLAKFNLDAKNGRH